MIKKSFIAFGTMLLSSLTFGIPGIMFIDQESYQKEINKMDAEKIQRENNYGTLIAERK